MPVNGVGRDAILLLAAVPLVYYVLAAIVAARFFRRERRRKPSSFAPPVSVLKPVRGVDFGSYENFASFCRQDYPDYQILFAPSSESDPAVPLLQRLMDEFPQRRVRLVLDAEQRGANRKVSKLIRLAREARHEILVLSDGDVRVGPDYLRAMVAPFADSGVGAVTALYRGIAEKNLGAELEAVGASSDFFAGVLMAEWMEGMSFALGASVATTRTWLDRIGGFEALSDVLSDDYELGHRIARAGGRVLLSREAVWTMYPAQTARGFFHHQVRWARTIRLCRPLSYVGLIFTHGLPWALLAAAIAPARWIALSYLAAYLILRMVMAWVVGVWGVRDDLLRRKLWLVPLRDAVNFAVWLAGFVSNRIVWNGIAYHIRGGRMIPVNESPHPEAPAPVSSGSARAPDR